MRSSYIGEVYEQAAFDLRAALQSEEDSQDYLELARGFLEVGVQSRAIEFALLCPQGAIRTALGWPQTEVQLIGSEEISKTTEKCAVLMQKGTGEILFGIEPKLTSTLTDFLLRRKFKRMEADLTLDEVARATSPIVLKLVQIATERQTRICCLWSHDLERMFLLSLQDR